MIRRLLSFWCDSVCDFARSINRMTFVAVTLAGAAAIAMCVRHTWFNVPMAPSGGAFGSSDVVLRSPGCTSVFQAVMAVLGICVASSWLWKRQWTLASTVLASAMCLVALSYPYFAMIRSPVVSAEANWLQMQHDNLLWLGGDIYNNAESGQRGWKTKVYMIDTSRQLAVTPLPSWSPWELGLERSHDLLLWLGYSNAFCQFVGKGWFFAVIGSFMLLFASLRTKGEFAFGRAGLVLVVFTIALVGAAVVGWSQPFRASRCVREARQAFSNQEYARSLQKLNDAVALLPVLAEDTYYVAQRGAIESALRRDTEYTRLQSAIGLERQARYDQAFTVLQPLIESETPAIRREALRGLMRFAIQDYNSGRFELADQRFQMVLRRQPCNVKLLYLMQVQAIRQSRSHQVDAMRDRMYAASNHFRFGTKKILRAAAQQNCAVATGMHGDANEIWDSQRRAKRP